MCLGIPGKVVRWVERDPLLAAAEVEFGGVRRLCQMACVPEAAEGDFVVVHAGVAISRIDPLEAERTLADLARLGEDRPEDGP
jgi:hydrogenase expression/formation protein HypC